YLDSFQIKSYIRRMADNRILGEDSIFFIKYNNIWCPISCETSSPISESVEMMNTTTRDNGGWKTEKPTLQSYSISVEAVLKLDDELPDSGVVSYNKLRLMKRNRELIEWKRETFGGWYIDQGQAYITEISDSNSVGEEITFSMSLSGFGAPGIDTARIDVLGESNTVLIAVNNDLIQVI